MIIFCPNLLFPLAIHHAGDADEDERNGQQLSHVECHACLERFLDVLGELDEETGQEHESEAQTYEEAAQIVL